MRQLIDFSLATSATNTGTAKVGAGTVDRARQHAEHPSGPRAQHRRHPVHRDRRQVRVRVHPLASSAAWVVIDPPRSGDEEAFASISGIDEVQSEAMDMETAFMKLTEGVTS